MQISVQEEMDPVAHDRAGKGAPELPAGEVGPVPGRVARRQAPLLHEGEPRAVEGVGSRLRHGVEEPACEVAKTHVEWRSEHLNFFDSLQGDRVGEHFGNCGAGTRAARRSP